MQLMPQTLRLWFLSRRLLAIIDCQIDKLATTSWIPLSIVTRFALVRMLSLLLVHLHQLLLLFMAWAGAWSITSRIPAVASLLNILQRIDSSVCGCQ